MHHIEITYLLQFAAKFKAACVMRLVQADCIVRACKTILL